MNRHTYWDVILKQSSRSISVRCMCSYCSGDTKNCDVAMREQEKINFPKPLPISNRNGETLFICSPSFHFSTLSLFSSTHDDITPSTSYYNVILHPGRLVASELQLLRFAIANQISPNIKICEIPIFGFLCIFDLNNTSNKIYINISSAYRQNTENNSCKFLDHIPVRCKPTFANCR